MKREIQSSTRREPRISDMKGGGRLLDADCIFAYQARSDREFYQYLP